MFSPLENEEQDGWFQRLNKPLKRLPAEERAELHAEVRQHLEALAAANEELGSTPKEAWEHALTQFGEPDKVGKRMAWEWRHGQGLIGPQLAAILCGVGVTAIALPMVMLINWLASTVTYLTMNIILVHELINGCTWVFGWAPSIVGAVVGRKHPHWALAGAFYNALTWPILPGLDLLSCGLQQSRPGPTIVLQCSQLYGFISVCWLLPTCGAAYVASVTKRGWYRPSLADFKIALPSRTKQVNR